MPKKRKIIEIDESKCTGCGNCIISCAEGALQLVDGKAKLVKDVYCDGLGACIGECPEDALRIVERAAEDYNEAEVEKLKRATEKKSDTAEKKEAPLACGCPSASAMTFDRPKSPAADRPRGEPQSELTHFPIQLQLLNPAAPFLKGADLLLLADCVAAAYPDLHDKLLRGRAVAMACPKLDDLEAHIEALTEILKVAGLKSLTVAIMEVPCCGGLAYAAEKAVEAAGVSLPLKKIIISRDGRIISQSDIATKANV